MQKSIIEQQLLMNQMANTITQIYNRLETIEERVAPVPQVQIKSDD